MEITFVRAIITPIKDGWLSCLSRGIIWHAVRWCMSICSNALLQNWTCSLSSCAQRTSHRLLMCLFARKVFLSHWKVCKWMSRICVERITQSFKNNTHRDGVVTWHASGRPLHDLLLLLGSSYMTPAYCRSIGLRRVTTIRVCQWKRWRIFDFAIRQVRWPVIVLLTWSLLAWMLTNDTRRSRWDRILSRAKHRWAIIHAIVWSFKVVWHGGPEPALCKSRLPG